MIFSFILFSCMLIQLESCKIKEKREKADSFIALRSVIIESFIMTIKWLRVTKSLKKNVRVRFNILILKYPLYKMKLKSSNIRITY